MDAKIQRFGKDAKGQDSAEGFYAVRPGSKQIVLMPPTVTKLKDGYRLATQQDLDGPAPTPIALAELADIHDDDLPKPAA